MKLTGELRSDIRIAAAFRKETLSLEQLRERFGQMSRDTMKSALQRLVREGVLERVGEREYRRRAS